MTEIFKNICELIEKNIPHVIITVIEVTGSAPGRPGARMVVLENGEIKGTIGGGAIEKKAREDALVFLREFSEPLSRRYNLLELGMTCGGYMTLFYEPVKLAERAFIFGGGHIALSLEKFLREIGFRVIIIDNRPDFANHERFPHAITHVLENYEINKLPASLLPGAGDYAVIVTHGHAFDEHVLRQLLGRNLSYLGMIGSRKKVKVMLANIARDGVPREELEKVYTPIGIAISGSTPGEIALSIAAEMQYIRRGGVLLHMKDAEKKAPSPCQG